MWVFRQILDLFCVDVQVAVRRYMRRSKRICSYAAAQGALLDVDRLKRATASPELLERMLRHALAHLELVSTVRAAAVGADVSKGKAQGNAPTGETNAIVQELRQAYVECTCNWDRLKVIRKAQASVRAATGNSGKPAYVRRSVQLKAAIANDVRASALVADDYGVSAEYVRKLRMQYKR